MVVEVCYELVAVVCIWQYFQFKLHEWRSVDQMQDGLSL